MHHWKRKNNVAVSKRPPVTKTLPFRPISLALFQARLPLIGQTSSQTG